MTFASKPERIGRVFGQWEWRDESPPFTGPLAEAICDRIGHGRMTAEAQVACMDLDVFAGCVLA